jgi:hypothetical protein
MTRLILVALVACVAACNTPSNEPAKVVEETPAAVKHDYGVKFDYSSDFELADAAYADKVVSLWKHYDANTLDSTKSYFADSVETEFPGSSGKFSRDSIMSMVKESRGRHATCVSTFDAIVPLKASGKDETAVSVWGSETVTDSKGKKMERDLNEVWIFNKDGKITYIAQFEMKK